MPVQCTLYRNTGFTPTNLPYDLAALEAAASNEVDAGPLDVVQIFGMTSISVRSFETNIYDVDYLRLQSGSLSAYYVVTGYVMSSYDVAVLSLAADPGLTAGGWDKISINSGMWSRAYDDKGGDMIVDGMLQLSEMPKIWYYGYGEQGVSVADDFLYIASTVRLDLVPDSADNKVAYTYDDTTGDVSYAFVPTPVDAAHQTKVIMQASRDFAGEYEGDDMTPVKLESITNGYAIYNYKQENIRKAVETLRAYGYESAIIGAWRVPGEFIRPISPADNPDQGGEYTKQNTDGLYIQIATVGPASFYGRSPIFDPSQLYSDASEDVQQLASIISHSDSYRIGLLSVPTGAKIEKRRVEATGWIFNLIDPRRGGCPYYILQDIPPISMPEYNDPRAYIAGELQKCGIQGSTWDAVPIIYEGSSGAARNYMKLYQSQKFAQETYEANMENVALTGMGGMLSAVPSAEGASLGNIGRAGASLTASIVAADSLTRARLQDAKSAMAQYVISNKLVAPQVTSQTIEGIQQYFGNYAIIYATYPSQADLLRFGEIAATFGLACNRPADQKIKKPVTCCYYAGTGIQVTTAQRVPGSVRKDIGDLLNIGVRLWSVKPRKLNATDWAGRSK